MVILFCFAMKPACKNQDSRLMRELFRTIAPRYDFITRAFSFGMDRRWKLRAVEKAALPEKAMVLDLACGTGDFSRLVAARLPGAKVVGVDLTEPMLRLARERGLGESVCGNAASLPFADGSFDCVFIGYGLRNFPSLNAAVREIVRVTKPGGLMVSLDFFLPSNRALRGIFLAYLYAQGALWGLLLHGDALVYTYIPDSLRQFVSMEEFAALLKRTGYRRIEARGFIFGGIGLHWAIRA